MVNREVKFDITKNKIHNMVAWSYAYKQARKGQWEQVALDRFRFHQRIKKVNVVLEKILNCSHRQRIYFERFTSN